MPTTSFALLETPPHVRELDRLGDEIAELSAHLDAATARLLALIREFDARGGWNTGFRSCAEWLSWRVGLAPGAAREWVRVARALGTLPRLSEALARGQLSCTRWPRRRASERRRRRPYGDDRHWVGDDMGVSEWLLTGTTLEGRPVRVRGGDHWEFRDGKVIVERNA